MAKNKSSQIDTLYKYTSIKFAINNLNDGSLRITDPKKFNDPFDCVAASFLLDKHRFLAHLKKRLEMALSKKHRNTELFHKFWNKVYPSDIGRLIDEFVFDVSKSINDLSDNWNTERGGYRVLSLAESNESILMWSHYAGNHSGVVLGFDANKGIFIDNKKVKYINMKTVFNVELNYLLGEFLKNISSENDSIDDVFIEKIKDKHLELFENTLYAKREDWRYERERRIVLSKNDLRIRHISNATENYSVIDFSKNELVSVVFGINSNQEEVDALASIVNSKYPDARLFRARRDGLDMKICNFEI